MTPFWAPRECFWYPKMQKRESRSTKPSHKCCYVVQFQCYVELNGKWVGGTIHWWESCWKNHPKGWLLRNWSFSVVLTHVHLFQQWNLDSQYSDHIKINWIFIYFIYFLVVYYTHICIQSYSGRVCGPTWNMLNVCVKYGIQQYVINAIEAGEYCNITQ